MCLNIFGFHRDQISFVTKSLGMGQGEGTGTQKLRGWEIQRKGEQDAGRERFRPPPLPN